MSFSNPPPSVEQLRQHAPQALAGFSWQPPWPLQERQTPAAVLVGLLPRAHGLQLVLTRRTDHLYHHAGQISFPGGRQEDEDAGLIATALRESNEEIGLLARDVEVLGCLPEYATPSNFRITPVLALLAPEAALQADPFEVAEIFEVPLAFACDERNYQAHRIHWQGGLREIPALPCNGRFIWGATAGILQMLAAFMAGIPRA
ncbi:MAG: CoA pyrophosphatase [Candidatus Dactylopiibacterium carminicum]|uniref:CoA pyrophosphatase n=1 Tax=Candidatus Dactylopiibacterium carminicum TaxID=857335 RepID=A0A272ERF5_9RHOO|nr:CoA pyrophosphatase [Candidatus Dactylopiibacterium carminicum]KAF7598566.1 CoA pyrophosphatase [Candidatus Dactylopiibacterium carminicum]PAS92300.1 MAG: CoA pyrophosphatase [Candidatus Dactylopiibacterium carminicum]PAS92705.1 MAG: CoA pyrophosphatase [Candidatus Dactylopiibacterium carminicum]PAS98227.1 MAG: hypothetical protein BSR46_12475 [Candidatus Dactylopiibacterium carminicum]